MRRQVAENIYLDRGGAGATGGGGSEGGEIEVILTTYSGTSRLVVVSGDIAVKFPRGPAGMRCNLFEAGIWARNWNHPTCGRHLCPVLWCHPKGRLLVMPAATPLDPSADAMAILAEMHADWWDYQPGGDDDPCEPKAADWGLLNGELVAVDYASLAIFDEN
jgi:hypothetical protein